jgi:L-seryl-tRNA(Ser) seleniumtransferase
MAHLQSKVGEYIAGTLGAEAAYVTAGTFSAQLLGAAGILTNMDPEKIYRLPDTTGMKSEFVFEKPVVYEYEFARCASTVGGKLIEVGDESGTTIEQLEAAVGDQTVGVLFLCNSIYYREKDKSQLPSSSQPPLKHSAPWYRGDRQLALQDVVDMAKRHGLPVLVDGAGVSYPDQMRALIATGADIVCFGAKYYHGPQAAGWIAGKKEWIEAAAENDFLAFHNKQNNAIGRGMKLDRQDIIATAYTVREWMEMDVDKYHETQLSRIGVIEEALSGLDHVEPELFDWPEGPDMAVNIKVGPEVLGKNADQVIQELAQEDPGVYVCGGTAEESVAVCPAFLTDEQLEVVAQQLKKVLTP